MYVINAYIWIIKGLDPIPKTTTEMVSIRPSKAIQIETVLMDVVETSWIIIV